MLDIENLSKMFTFEIEKGFLEKVASFKVLKDVLVGVCSVHSRKKTVFWAIRTANGKTQKCKKTTLIFWRKEKSVSRDCPNKAQNESQDEAEKFLETTL